NITMDTGLRVFLASVLSWYLVFFCEHFTHYLMHAPWASRLPLCSLLRGVHMRHHERYRPLKSPSREADQADSMLLREEPYRGDGGGWLVLPSLPTLAALWLALPRDLFALVACESALFLAASNHLHSQFHVAGSWLERFEWFHRRRRYHF